MAGVFGGRFAACAAIDPFFSRPIYHSFSRAPRNGGRNPNSVTVMLSASIIRRFSGAAYRFVGADQGNIAVIFAIALVPLISFMGAAIDYSRANRARSSMQSALDSTALMVSKDLSSGLITTSQINAKAQAYFAALYTDTEAQGVTVSATYTASNGSMGSTVQVTGSAYITTDFMNIAGFPTLDFSTNSTAAMGQYADARGVGARQHGIDVAGWKADGAAKCRRRIRRSHRPAQRARQEFRRCLHLGRSVCQGRQRRRQQL